MATSPSSGGHSSFEFETQFTVPDSEDWQSTSSPSSSRQMLGDNNGSSRSAAGSRRRFAPAAVAFVKKIDWSSIWDMAKEWIRSPMNMALMAWIMAVVVSGAILFMVMTGMLNHVLTSKSQRDTWFEVNNQILNALFTLMCLYQHPRRFYHLALLCRWAAADMLRLRQVYCKGGTVKPGERKHMTVVVLLLHLNCFAQYALCGLNLGFERQDRPVLGVALTVSVAIGAPAIAGLYNNLSPLGNDYEAQPAEEEESSPDYEYQLQQKTTMTSASRTRSRTMTRSWAGGLFDVYWEDISLAYLSVFCSCCLFGWNMGRLGLGNMYVHVATFLLLCLAPFFVFNLAAINIDDEQVRDALGLAGIFLCVFGLLYGGFWRIQMRRRLGLPATSHACCCGKPDVSDCLSWLCCYSCALAQEVRTADAILLQQGDGVLASSSWSPAAAGGGRGGSVVVSDNNNKVTVPPPVLSVVIRN